MKRWQEFYSMSESRQAMIDQLKAELRQDEGVRAFPYDDSNGKTINLSSGGNVTIGVGHNLSAAPLPEPVIDWLLSNDITAAMQIALRLFPDLETWSQNRQCAICNLIFNIGEKGFIGFKNTIRAIREQRWDGAADNLMLSKWYQQIQPSRRDRIVKHIRNG
jgi:lysozyme